MTPAPAPAIRLEALSYAWPGQPCLLDIDALEIARGERILLQGASGSGKSTLLGLLAGVLRPQRGRIDIEGTCLGALRPAQCDAFRADHIGVIFQMFNLLPFLSVRDNVALPCRFSRRRMQRATARRPLADEVDRMLARLGLDPARLGERQAGGLSVGQQQRVAAARALVGQPPLLIADEPTSALDAEARDAFLALLLGQCARAGSTLVFVSHDAALSPYFSRSLRLDELNRAAVPRVA